MSIDEQIEIIKACKEGKDLQMRKRDSDNRWTDFYFTDPEYATWSFDKFDYRIKPEEDDDPSSYPSEFEYGGNTYHVNELDFSKDMDGNVLIGIKGIRRIRIVGGWEKESKSSERMTNRQMSEWLAKGHGEWIFHPTDYPSISSSYKYGEEDEPVEDEIRIRRFGSEDWIVPTKEIYEHDCTAKGLYGFFSNIIATNVVDNHDDEDKKPLIIRDSDEAYKYQGKTGWFADSLDDIKNTKITEPAKRYHGILVGVKGFLYNMVSDRKDCYGENVPYGFFMPDEVIE